MTRHPTKQESGRIHSSVDQPARNENLFMSFDRSAIRQRMLRTGMSRPREDFERLLGALCTIWYHQMDEHRCEDPLCRTNPKISNWEARECFVSIIEENDLIAVDIAYH